jgi:hypothetical protein
MAVGFRRALIVHPGLSDSAAITGDTAASTDTAVTKLQTENARERYVTESVPTVTIDVPLVDNGFEEIKWNFVALLYTNMGAADELEVAAGTQGGGSPSVLESGILRADGGAPRGREWHHAWWFGGDDVERTDNLVRLTLTINDPILPAGYSGDPYFSAARLIVGKAWRPTHNILQGHEYLPALDSDLVVEAFDGQNRRFRRGSKRGHRFTIGWMFEAEALGFLDLIAWRRGSASDTFVVLDPTSDNVDRMSYHGPLKLSAIQSGVQVPGGGVHQSQVEIVQEVAD